MKRELPPTELKFTELEEVDVESLLPTSVGELEMKRGELCLRIADMWERKSLRKATVTRTWLRPNGQPFDENLYRRKSPTMARGGLTT